MRSPTGRRLLRRATAMVAAVAIPLAAMVGLAGPAHAAGATATYQKAADWGTGFEGRWTVKNTGTDPLSSWSVSWDFPAGTSVTSAWDADVSHSGTRWTAKSTSYNGTLAPGASVTFGFNGSGSGGGAVTGCTLNGDPCDGGGVPGDNAPSAPGTPSAGNISDTSVVLSWTAATDDKGIKNYDVYRGGTRIATVADTRYTDTGLTAGTTYSYSVRARDTADQVGPSSPSRTVTTTGGGGPGGDTIKMGYFTEWGVYDRNYHAKNLDTSGTAQKINTINYAFGNVQNGRCTMGDSFAAIEKSYTAGQSVDGVADTWDQPLRGNFNQLLKLKKKHPHLRILWSFGGWTWSGGFTQAMQNPAAFAQSCYDLVYDPRWQGLFDGIDLDWEYPNACGLTCDSSGPAVMRNMMQAFRAKFGDELLTAAITADASGGGKIEAADYAGAAQYVDWYNVMTYDFFGAWDAQGPTAPHSPLTSYDGIPNAAFHSDAAIQKLKGLSIPPGKLLLGIGFYGRGWTGVTQSAPGGSATGPAPGRYEQGIDDYKELKSRCPATGTVAGTAYAHCGSQWWSYDTPATITAKMAYARNQNLGGAFVWELSGDTADGELMTAVHNGLG